MQAPSIRVLLVDDDRADVRAVERVLKASEMDIFLETRQNGLEALRRLATPRPPHLILLDLNTPKMGGLEFLHELRNRADLPQPVIFILSTSGRVKEQSAAYALNVAGYIQKRSAGPGFRDLAAMLSSYLKLVDLPRYSLEAD